MLKRALQEILLFLFSPPAITVLCKAEVLVPDSARGVLKFLSIFDS